MDQQDIVNELARLADQNARFEAEISRLREERIPAVDRSSRRRDRRLTVAYLAAAALAVGLADVGSASALDGSNTVFSDDIVDGSVTTFDVAKNSLITSDIKDNSIAGRDLQDGTIGSVDVIDGNLAGVDIADGSIAGVDVANGSLSGYDVADGTIRSSDLDVGSVTGAEVNDGTLTGADVSNGSLNGDDIDLFNDHRCTIEALLGTALINADPAVPSTYTTDWIGYPHSCSGETVQVRRVAAGGYSITFGGNNPARLAVVTQNTSGGAQASAVISVEALDPGQFYVQTKVNGSYADVDFTIVVL
jgi:hypothetical protein